MKIKRGDLFLAALDPVLGHEIAKTRPVIIVSNNIGNTWSGTVTVLPVTSQHLDKIYPFEVFLSCDDSRLKTDSKAKADQIRTLDKRRLIRKIGGLIPDEMRQVDAAIRVHLGL